MVHDMPELKPRRIALLIDGDNAQPSLITKILAEAGKYGTVTIRRIYGDWTTSNMKGWKDDLHNHAIQPIQQFRYTKGKNATDSAMIIDAMDILHSGLVDGFGIVSSDSDYTRLATRIREAGIFVMGVGKQQTPKSFVNACNVFIYTENLVEKKPQKKQPQKQGGQHHPEPPQEQQPERAPKADAIPLLKQAFDMALREDGTATLATMGFNLRQLDPGFDPRTYGFKQLSQLMKNLPDAFETVFNPETGNAVVTLKLKED